MPNLPITTVKTKTAAQRAQARGQANRQPPAGKHWCARCSRRFAPDGRPHCDTCLKELRAAGR